MKVVPTLEPGALGIKLGALRWERQSGDFGLKSDVGAVANALLNAAVHVGQVESDMRPILVHLDELDQGLNVLDEARKSMITGLVIAARNIRTKFGDGPPLIRPVVYLRTDLWDQLRFSDKNKITQTSTVRIEWTPDELKKLIERRASVKLDAQVYWEDLEDGELMRGSQKKWMHMVSRTYLRPRDIIKFCNEVLEIARTRDARAVHFINDDVNLARDRYSAYLRSELDDEIVPHWPTWHVALDALSAIETVTFQIDQFKENFDARRTLQCPSADEALERLFDFSVIGWERRAHTGGSSWTFRYISSDTRWDPSAHRFKTHPGLKEYLRLKETRG
jgi:hypothetical protein